MPIIYIVDDEANIRRLASLALQDYSMETETFADGKVFLAAVKRKLPDLVIVDWMMPPPDGLQICRELRADPQSKNLPIIMLTARTDELDRVLGLEMGADDYISKPFGVKELPARVRALLRRRKMDSDSPADLIVQGPVKLYPSRRRVSKHGEEITLTQKEFDLLAQLMSYPVQVFTREMLLDRIWQTDFFGDTRTVDVHIRYLRQKLEDEPNNPTLILTVRGVGYCFAEGLKKEE